VFKVPIYQTGKHYARNRTYCHGCDVTLVRYIYSEQHNDFQYGQNIGNLLMTLQQVQ
jgi:hypothetical protein